MPVGVEHGGIDAIADKLRDGVLTSDASRR